MFSGALQLTDLNDFITPSQECVKPVQVIKKGGKAGSVVVSDDGDFFEMKEDGVQEKLQKAKITLNDCLACSGCITSAESILITEQSQEEFFKILEQNQLFKEAKDFDKVKTIVVSISPQSRASLAAKYKLDVETAADKLMAFFHTLGVKYVFDTTLAREFSLIESQKEFLYRYRIKDSGGVLPMLNSACPGWVCYAEKTHGDYILPYISLVKSPQQIMGSLVKNYLADKIHVKPNQIYHMTIMPCFDKKLEASRNDFYNEIYGVRDVDCVITSVEVEAMLETTKISLNDLPAENIEQLKSENPFAMSLYTHSGSTSGGYCEHVFVNAVKELFGDDVSHLEFKMLRNQDLKEIVYEKDGETLLRFAIANGFRNIQNIVQKLKRGKSPYHFVEIMACPSGCINGGAQIRATGEESPKDLVLRMEHLYHSLPSKSPLGEENPLIRQLYKEWLESEENPEKLKQLLYTQYHAVSKKNNALFIKW